MKGQGLKDKRTINENSICISANVLRKLLRGFLSTQQPGMIFAQHQQDMLPLFPTLSTSQDEARSWPVCNTLLYAKVPLLPFFSWLMIFLSQSFLGLPDDLPTSQLQPSLRAMSSLSLMFWTTVWITEFKGQEWLSHNPLPASEFVCSHLLSISLRWQQYHE